MRPLFALLVLIIPLFGEEAYEFFTLRDGRRLVGTYDADRQYLSLAGPVSAGIHVEATTILERRTAHIDEIPKAAEAPNPEKVRLNRIAWLRTSMRGLDNSISQRANHRAIIGKRLDQTRSDLAVTELRCTTMADSLATLIEDYRHNQDMADELAQQRAMTDLRLRSIIVDHDNQDHHVEISEITTELSKADCRLAELRERLRSLSTTIAQRRNLLANARADSARMAAEISEEEARLASYAKADAEATMEHARLDKLLAELEAEDSAP
jgi:chromosome segregation ATPase